MCGIAGNLKPGNVFNPTVLETLGHRGPDEQTYCQFEEIILYHTRLSIQDISEGHQPMLLGDQLAIVFNGEIYNHQELRTKFNLKCKTRSDTETVLHLYNALGIAFLHELDGMFAMAILDRQKKKLWLVRDRVGKKPLYYYHFNNELFFASELNTVNRCLDLQYNEQYFFEYLRLGGFYRSHTPYQNVHELAAGCYLCIDLVTHKSDLEQWWNIKKFYQQQYSIGVADAVTHVGKLIDTGVRRRMVSSDLEVGCFLSGGIDSGLVASAAAKHTSRLKTFTVAFNGAYNEAPLAKLVAEKIGSTHTEIDIDFSDLSNNVETILANYGEPFMDSSAIPTWYVSREAKKHVTVILTGDGADELFGGYRRHVPFTWYDFFKSPKVLCNVANGINRLLPVSNNKRSLYNYLFRLTSLAKANPADVYLRASADIFEGYIENAFSTSNGNTFDFIENDVAELVSELPSGLKKMLMADFSISLFSLFLVKMDIGTMAHALEARSPFLCKEILEWAPGLPDNLKITGGKTKFLLRTYAKQVLPKELINQPKRGFEIPLKEWVNGNLKEIIYSYIFSGSNFSSNFVDRSFVKKLWNNQINIGDEKRAKILWTLFALEVWYKKSYVK